MQSVGAAVITMMMPHNSTAGRLGGVPRSGVSSIRGLKLTKEAAVWCIRAHDVAAGSRLSAASAKATLESVYTTYHYQNALGRVYALFILAIDPLWAGAVSCDSCHHKICRELAGLATHRSLPR